MSGCAEVKLGSREGLGTRLWEKPFHRDALDLIPTALRTCSFPQKPQKRDTGVSEAPV